MKDIHMSTHGSISIGELMPIKEVFNHGTLLDKLNMPENIDKSLEYLQVDESDILIDPNSLFAPIIYLKDFVLVEMMMFDVEYLKTFNIKEYIKFLTDRMEKLISSNDWNAIFSIMEKRLIIPKFIESYRKIPKDQIVDVFSNVWMRSECGFHLIEEDLISFVYKHGDMSQEYKERKESLRTIADGNEYIKIYRGSGEGIRDGYSWTLDREMANWFANRFGKNGSVYEGKVAVSHIIDYFTGRGESEVVVNPKDVQT